MDEERKHGLGRLAKPDERDRAFPMRKMLRQPSARRWRYWWAEGWHGDQGPFPQCVAYAWNHFLEDGPGTYPGKGRTKPLVKPVELYSEAQRVDEWDGENYDGTSVRAGAKVLASRGIIGSYHWAWDMPTLIDALLETGPVVVGTWWMEGMDTPELFHRKGARDAYMMRATGRQLGGHAYVLNGINLDAKLLRMKNSWGKRWGNRGHAFISFDDFERLLADGGEACIATEPNAR